MKKSFTITILVCLMMIVGYVWSETVYVNDEMGNDETGERGNPEKPFKTIQAGIDAAEDGDNVLVADGIYTGEGNIYLQINQPFQHEKNIIVESENGYEHTIIDCSGDPGPGKKRGAFTFNNSGEDERTIIRGFTMTGGDKEGNGGAIACVKASPTITNNKIIGNSADEGGGGIACQDASPTIANNIITGNSTSKHGGAIVCKNSAPKITNNTITGNFAESGAGAILFYGFVPEMIDGVIIDSIHSEVTNNKIIGNSATNGGGIVCDFAASPTIANNIIAENWAIEKGGGILCDSNANPTITYNTIADNSAGDYGGGIFCRNAASPIVLNSILWNNSPEEIYLDPTATASITVYSSDVQGGEAGIGGSGTVTWGDNNIDTDPLLYINRPVTDTLLYHLTDYSPCIGAGTDTDIPDDIDGEPRPQPDISIPDIGADENARETPLPRGDVSGNEIVTAYDASLTLQHVVGLINLSEGQQKGADVTGDKLVSALDAALILQHTVGLITTFPAEIGAGAPILDAKSESELLADAIKKVEKFPLDREQKEVVKLIKSWFVGSIMPTNTALLQNYPNPFNPETWLPYKLAQDAFVTVRIYNTKGQLIRLLHLGEKQAGNYVTKEKAAYWDGRDELGQRVASGVYFYTLQAEHPKGDSTGKYTETRRMVVLK